MKVLRVYEARKLQELIVCDMKKLEKLKEDNREEEKIMKTRKRIKENILRFGKMF